MAGLMTWKNFDWISFSCLSLQAAPTNVPRPQVPLRCEPWALLVGTGFVTSCQFAHLLVTKPVVWLRHFLSTFFYPFFSPHVCLLFTRQQSCDSPTPSEIMSAAFPALLIFSWWLIDRVHIYLHNPDDLWQTAELDGANVVWLWPEWSADHERMQTTFSTGSLLFWIALDSLNSAIAIRDPKPHLKLNYLNTVSVVCPD